MKTEEAVDRLADVFPIRAEHGPVFTALLNRMALGRPIAPAEIAGDLGWPIERLESALQHMPRLERNERGEIVGAGISLEETPHLFEVDGRRLYTWCALDALLFPMMIGKRAHVTSPCAATGSPVRVTVTPDGIGEIDPVGAVVSVVLPEAIPPAELRRVFCNHVNFFASREAAAPWLSQHPHAIVLPVADAYRFGVQLANRLWSSQSTCC